MPSLNKVMLMGNLTKDAELRFLPSGQPLLEFRLACNRKYKTANGQDGEDNLFIDVTLWGPRGQKLEPYLKKGTGLFVEGRLKLDEWERDGVKRSKISVVAMNIEFLGGGRDRNESGGQQGNYQRRGNQGGSYQGSSGGGGYNQGGGNQGGGYGGGGGYQPPPQQQPAPVASGGGGMDIAEEEIPF